MKGVILFHKDKFEEALGQAELAICLNPNNFRTFAFRGVCQSLLELSEEAMLSFDESIRQNPNITSLYHRGHLFLMKGDLENSLKDFTTHVGMCTHPLGCLSLAQVYLKRREYDQALEVLRPSSFFQGRHLDLLILNAKSGQLDEALDDVNRAIEGRPQASLYGVRATILGLKGFKSKALDDIEHGCQLSSDETTLYRLGKIKEQLQKLEDTGSD